MELIQHRQGRAPLCQAVAEHLRHRTVSFHLPAHKGGRWVDPEWARLLGRRAYEADLTELPGLDDLHAPREAIAEAQQLAREAFGADETFFLVNGSTAGLQALVLATASPGDRVILPRNVHRAIIGAVALAGARPVWVAPEFDPGSGVLLGPSAAALSDALRQHPGAASMVVLHPTYEGLVGDWGAIVEEAHAAGVAVLADEAHGAHFAFHPGLPRPALRLGADASVQSLHKTLGSLTGSSLLHLPGRRVDAARVRAALGLLQTSSPSYLLMGSLDAARRWAVQRARPRLETLLEAVAAAVEQINHLEGLHCWSDELLRLPGVAGRDPLRLLLDGRAMGLGGMQLQAELRTEGVWLEMATPTLALAVVSLADTRRSLGRLVAALRVVGERMSAGGPHPARRDVPSERPLPALPPAVLSPREAFFHPATATPLADAAGRISTATVAVSPPGIPVVCPGELVTREVIDYVRRSLEMGATVTGLLAAEPPLLATAPGREV